MTRRVRTALRAGGARSSIEALDPTALAMVAATAYVEIRTGRRHVQQLEGIATRSVLRRLQALVCRTRGARTPGGGVSTRRPFVCRLSEDLVEVSVVLSQPRGIGAVAVRLERRHGRWWVTELAAPEDRRPRPTATEPRT